MSGDPYDVYDTTKVDRYAENRQLARTLQQRELENARSTMRDMQWRLNQLKETYRAEQNRACALADRNRALEAQIDMFTITLKNVRDQINAQARSSAEYIDRAIACFFTK